MIKIIGDGIISSLGISTEENFQHILDGKSGLRLIDDESSSLDPYYSSLVEKDNLSSIVENIDKYTKLEAMSIASILNAVEDKGIDLGSKDTIFIFSSTKGNIDLLNSNNSKDLRIRLWKTAEIISKYFHNENEPMVVSNACISGVSAQILASRLLKSRKYKRAVVVGADLVSKFTVSGFQSFHSLADKECQPFDKNRVGLNIGEAAACIILQYEDEKSINKDDIILLDGIMKNDANHISGPSRTGEGSFRCLNHLLKNTNTDKIAFINAHGTATNYNDEMESIALERAGLADVPVNSMKAYFGHTLGAAGVLESIISARALKEGLILPTKGYVEKGVSGNIRISDKLLKTNKNFAIKLISGFGGCNAALLFKKI